MLRELNENEMMMVSGGALSDNDGSHWLQPSMKDLMENPYRGGGVYGFGGEKKNEENNLLTAENVVVTGTVSAGATAGANIGQKLGSIWGVFGSAIGGIVGLVSGATIVAGANALDQYGVGDHFDTKLGLPKH